MGRTANLVFSILAYAYFFATFLYLIAFVGNLPWVPATVDRGPRGPVATSLVVDIALIALFGVQHSLMARQGFKRWWTRFVPVQSERSVYVVAASTALIVLFLFWRPIEGVVWATTGPLALILWTLFGMGWLIVLLSTFLLNHFELFGLQQAWFHHRGREAADPTFRTPLFYRLVRHPLYLGFFIAFWATPVMTLGHLLLAAGMSFYMLVAIQLEERDLIAFFGDKYVEYRRRVGMLLPRIG